MYRKTKQQSSERLHAKTRVLIGTQKGQNFSYNNSLCGYIRLQRSCDRLRHYVIRKTDTHVVEKHLVCTFSIQVSIVSMRSTWKVVLLDPREEMKKQNPNLGQQEQ
jgi:hypothetical protein